MQLLWNDPFNIFLALCPAKPCIHCLTYYTLFTVVNTFLAFYTQLLCSTFYKKKIMLFHELSTICFFYTKRLCSMYPEPTVPLYTLYFLTCPAFSVLQATAYNPGFLSPRIFKSLYLWYQRHFVDVPNSVNMVISLSHPLFSLFLFLR